MKVRLVSTCVGLFDCLLDGHRFHCSVVDKEQQSCTLEAIICVADPAFCLEPPALTLTANLNKLIRDRVAVDLSYTIHGSAVRGN